VRLLHPHAERPSDTLCAALLFYDLLGACSAAAPKKEPLFKMHKEQAALHAALNMPCAATPSQLRRTDTIAYF
jgi:hypothetical protein